MKIFQTVKKVTVSGSGDGVDATAAAGTDTGTGAGTVNGQSAPQPAGQEQASADLQSGALNTPAGAQAASGAEFDQPVSGNGTHSAGTEADAGGATVVGSNSVPIPLGAAAFSSAGSATAILTAYAQRATENVGTGWANETNAQGAVNGTVASCTASAGTTVASSWLYLDNFGSVMPAALPSGYTITKVELEMRQRIDTTVGALSAAQAEIFVQKVDGSSQQPVFGVSVNERNDAALGTETVDITSQTVGSGWSYSDLRNMDVICIAQCNLIAVTGGNYAYEVDACYLKVTCSRSGIT